MQCGARDAVALLDDITAKGPLILKNVNRAEERRAKPSRIETVHQDRFFNVSSGARLRSAGDISVAARLPMFLSATSRL